eukprot:GHVP01053064.1.p1 GENE.GHVP01053064.1~~GHVP01053064.1.p1  ORF type:complete len:671 (-),score=138.56 GHVP01053064.1:269-2281(-)
MAVGSTSIEFKKILIGGSPTSLNISTKQGCPSKYRQKKKDFDLLLLKIDFSNCKSEMGNFTCDLEIFQTCEILKNQEFGNSEDEDLNSKNTKFEELTNFFQEVASELQSETSIIDSDYFSLNGKLASTFIVKNNDEIYVLNSFLHPTPTPKSCETPNSLFYFVLSIPFSTFSNELEGKTAADVLGSGSGTSLDHSLMFCSKLAFLDFQCCLILANQRSQIILALGAYESSKILFQVFDFDLGTFWYECEDFDEEITTAIEFFGADFPAPVLKIPRCTSKNSIVPNIVVFKNNIFISKSILSFCPKKTFRFWDADKFFDYATTGRSTAIFKPLFIHRPYYRSYFDFEVETLVFNIETFLWRQITSLRSAQDAKVIRECSDTEDWKIGLQYSIDSQLANQDDDLEKSVKYESWLKEVKQSKKIEEGSRHRILFLRQNFHCLSVEALATSFMGPIAELIRSDIPVMTVDFHAVGKSYPGKNIMFWLAFREYHTMGPVEAKMFEENRQKKIIQKEIHIEKKILNKSKIRDKEFQIPNEYQISNQLILKTHERNSRLSRPVLAAHIDNFFPDHIKWCTLQTLENFNLVLWQHKSKNIEACIMETCSEILEIPEELVVCRLSTSKIKIGIATENPNLNEKLLLKLKKNFKKAKKTADWIYLFGQDSFIEVDEEATL